MLQGCMSFEAVLVWLNSMLSVLLTHTSPTPFSHFVQKYPHRSIQGPGNRWEQARRLAGRKIWKARGIPFRCGFIVASA